MQTGITTPLSSNELSVAVDPVSHTVRISGAVPSSRVTVYSLSGSIMLEGRTDTDGTATLDATGLTHGLYILRAGTTSRKILL